MAKTLSAASMLSTAARRPAATSSLVHQAPSRSGDQATTTLDDQWSKRPGAQATSAPVDQATRGPETQRYAKAAVFLTPDQRQWLKATAKALPDGLSMSDIVRYALDELMQSGPGGESLTAALAARAHADARAFAGRRNRGLPPAE